MKKFDNTHTRAPSRQTYLGPQLPLYSHQTRPSKCLPQAACPGCQSPSRACQQDRPAQTPSDSVICVSVGALLYFCARHTHIWLKPIVVQGEIPFFQRSPLSRLHQRTDTRPRPRTEVSALGHPSRHGLREAGPAPSEAMLNVRESAKVGLVQSRFFRHTCIDTLCAFKSSSMRPWRYTQCSERGRPSSCRMRCQSAL